MVAGRPRTVSFEPDEMIKLGEEMVAYARANQKNLLHLSQWYSLEKQFTEKQWETFVDRAEFIPYYEQALKLVGLNYLDKNSNVREGASQRWQRTYFKDLREREDKEAREEAERKAIALKGDARAAEEEKQKVIDEVQRNRKPIV